MPTSRAPATPGGFPVMYPAPADAWRRGGRMRVARPKEAGRNCGRARERHSKMERVVSEWGSVLREIGYLRGNAHPQIQRKNRPFDGLGIYPKTGE